MSKILLGSAALLIAAGCATTHGESYRGGPVGTTNLAGGVDSLRRSNDPQVAEKQRERIGKFTAKHLESGCEKVEHYIKDNGHLVIRCYNKDKGQYWGVFGVDIDEGCRAVSTKTTLLSFIPLEDLVTVEDKSGQAATSPNLKGYDAQVLTELFGKYIDVNNEKICIDYRLWKQMYDSPGGPQ